MDAAVRQPPLESVEQAQNMQGQHQDLTKVHGCLSGDVKDIDSCKRRILDPSFDRAGFWMRFVLSTHFNENGRLLFEYHAISMLGQAFEADEELRAEVPKLRHIWEHLDGYEKSFWYQSTRKLKGGLERGQRIALVHLETGTSTKSARIHSEKVARCVLGAAEKAGLPHVLILQEKVESLRVDSIFPSHETSEDEETRKALEGISLGDYPVLHGHSPSMKGSGEARFGPVVDEITSTINDWQANYSDGHLVLQGRVSSARVDFSPSAWDATSVPNRLLQIHKQGSFVSRTSYDDHSFENTAEWMLRALVYWNRDAFDNIPGAWRTQNNALFPKKQRDTYVIHYRSCFNWLNPEELASLRPLAEEKREQVVDFLMNKFRPYVLQSAGQFFPPRARLVIGELQNGKSSPKLQNNNGIASLLSNDGGFAQHLRSCFDRKGLDSDIYEDLLEQQFFRFMRSTGGKKEGGVETDTFDLCRPRSWDREQDGVSGDDEQESELE